MFDFLKRIFKKSTISEYKPMPEWQDIVEMMYDRNLDSFQGKIIKVLYSKDKTARCVVLKDKTGTFRYCFEILYQFDQDEWEYICNKKDAFPAMWIEPNGEKTVSIFDTEESVMRELLCDPYYKIHFM